MILRSVVVSSVVASVVALGILLSSRPAAAQSPNQAFNGRIMMSSKRFPQKAASPSAYTAAVRKQSQVAFAEDKESHTWKIYFAGFLKIPLNDLEYVIKVYQLTGKSQQLVKSFEQYTDSRGQQTIISTMTLDKREVGVNKQLMMTMECKGKILASSEAFKIVGEGEHFTGKVDFSEDEAEGKKDE